MSEKGHYDPERGGWITPDGGLIRINSDDNKAKISIYNGDERVKGGHERDTINLDYITGQGTIDYHNEDKSEKTSDPVGCYLTTACMKWYQEVFDDNCEELTTLRWFRDNFVPKEDIELYYIVAPTIVEAIDSLAYEEKGSLYNYIYNQIVKYCVNAIKNNEYDKAYQRYKASVLTLQDEFYDIELEEQKVLAR